MIDAADSYVNHPGLTIEDYTWDATSIGGGITSGSSPVFEVSDIGAGNYQVILTATDSAGVSSQKVIEFEAKDFVPSFTHAASDPNLCASSESIRFTVTNAPGFTDAQSYRWSVNGSFIEETSNRSWSHIFDKDDTDRNYNVGVISVDSQGNQSDIYAQTVTIVAHDCG